jgi:hypothetical protein
VDSERLVRDLAGALPEAFSWCNRAVGRWSD